jgi:hypothetical protein
MEDFLEALRVGAVRAGIAAAVVAFVVFVIIIAVDNAAYFKLWFRISLTAALLVFGAAFTLQFRHNIKESQKADLKRITDKNNKANEAYLQKLRTYNSDKTRRETADRQYAAALQEHEKDVGRTLLHNVTVIEQNAMIDSVNAELGKQLTTLENTRDRLYSLGVLYPKYQNLIAITSFYEYLESGRCDALGGANGAYNLFETEKRMDVIIYKMDVILASLKQIAVNQHKLYLELVRVNKNVEALATGLSRKMKELAEGQAVLAGGIAQASGNSKAAVMGIQELGEYVAKLGEVNMRVLNYIAARK